MKRSDLENLTVDAATEIEIFASIDHATRRFIAHALTFQPPWPNSSGGLSETVNPPLPFQQSDAEKAERAVAYHDVAKLRDANISGRQGQAMRRQAFGILLGMAKCDLKWKRIRKMEHLIFCYERLAGHRWKELLPLIWKESALQRRKKGPTQLPLDRRILDDANVPNVLENDPMPCFYPTMVDADAFDAPLLGLL